MSNEKYLQRFRELCEAFRQQYDYVIIDTPPLLVASEALLLGKAADAALICAIRDRSRIEQVFAACDRLRAVARRGCSS